MALSYVVRPQRIAPVGAEPAGACAVAATVTDVLPRGDRALVLASTAGPELRVELDAEAAEALERGSPLTLTWSGADAVVFAEQPDAVTSSPVVAPEAEIPSVA